MQLRLRKDDANVRRAPYWAGAGVAALVLAGSAMAIEPASADAEDHPHPDVATVENLGVALTTVRMTASTPGEWTDGRPVIYGTSAQPEQPLRFVVLDAANGELLEDIAVEELAGAHDLVIGDDGNVYVAGWGPRGDLLRSRS